MLKSPKCSLWPWTKSEKSPAGQKKGCHKSEAACPDACMHTKIAGGLGYNTDTMGEQSRKMLAPWGKACDVAVGGPLRGCLSPRSMGWVPPALS